MQTTTSYGLYPDELLYALREEGLNVKLAPGWKTLSGRGALSPVRGVVLGPTVSGGLNRSLGAVQDTFRGPTAHGVVASDGTVWLTASGRVRHAGQGSADVLRAVSLCWLAPPPVMNTVDGDRHFYGFRAVHSGDGRDSWPEVQIEALVALTVGLCRAHGWMEGTPPVLGSQEWSRGARGLAGLDMADVRLRVWERLAEVPEAA